MQPTSSGYLLEHVASILHRQADQILQERLGLGISQLKILELVARAPHAKQRALAAGLGQTEASISRQIKLLQQKGLLITQIDPAERRNHLATLTSKGVKITQACHDVLEQFQQDLVANLQPREQEQLQHILTKLHEFACAPGSRFACERPGDIETIYADQSTAEKL